MTNPDINEKKLLRYNFKNNLNSFFSFFKFEIASSSVLTTSFFSWIVFLNEI